MPQTNFTTEILPQKSRTELSGTEFIKFLELKKESKKKNYNRNVFSVRTNDNISSLIREYCQLKIFLLINFLIIYSTLTLIKVRFNSK